MPITDSKTANRRRYRRLFRREKPSYIDTMTYSYQYMMRFPRLPITVPPFVPTLMSYRWNDEDDCEPLPKKSLRNHQQHIRRRIPKRYSDIVSPSSSKNFFPRKDSITREKQILFPSCQPDRPSSNVHRRHSLKPINETFHCFNSHNKKSRETLPFSQNLETKDRRHTHKTKHLSTINPDDILAHRMQAAMSSELMHSLDRNFVFGDRHKQSTNHLFMNRSHSFNIFTPLTKEHHYHLIPRVKLNFEKENIPIDEPTPDYDEQNEDIIIRRIENNDDIDEEPIVDYDDPKPIINNESDEKSITHSDFGISSSFIVPQISIMPTSEEQTSTPPVPPPLPNLTIEQKKIVFRCRTIADQLSPDHKLILKDEEERKLTTQSEPSKTSDQIPSKPHYFHISKDLPLRKLSKPLSRSFSSYGSISQLNDRDTELTTLCAKPTITDEQIQDGLSSSSPATSILIDNEYEHPSSSSKIYNDYKKRASLISVPTSTILSHSIIVHPMHTRIGLRSSTSSSSTNEKLTDMTLSSKQMNVCVINQLNEHLSTRFRKQQQESCSNNNTDHQSYDPPPDYTTDNNNNNNNMQSNVYDEPNDVTLINPISSSSVPPPPPPLPVGGFRPILIPPVNRSSNSQRTSIMTLPREANNSNIACSTGTSTISSNLSDTRILSELRENPLFTKAKQHLEIEPGSNGRRSGRRSIGSTSNLTHTESKSNEIVSYLRLDNCSKIDSKKTTEQTNSQQMETIIMHPNELNAILGKRTQSTNDINRIKPRLCTRSFIQTQCRQSELELIFQKRAQRSEQNLT